MGRLRLLVPVILGFLVVQLPAPHFGQHASRWFQARDRGDRLLAEGRGEEAVRAFEEAIAWDRPRLDLGGPMTSSVLRARTLFRYHLALRSVGRVSDALPHLEEARRLTPDDPLITRALADGYHSTGFPARADSLYTTLDSLQGGSGLAAASRGWHAAQRGALPEAELHFLHAVAQAPRLDEAWGALVRVQAQVGKTRAARASLAQAREAGLPNSSFYAHLAFLAAVDGERALARQSLSRVPVAALRADASLADVARLARELMGNE
jgi:tetratricopeptide (TPR) repeat protein